MTGGDKCHVYTFITSPRRLNGLPDALGNALCDDALFGAGGILTVCLFCSNIWSTVKTLDIYTSIWRSEDSLVLVTMRLARCYRLTSLTTPMGAGGGTSQRTISRGFNISVVLLYLRLY